MATMECVILLVAITCLEAAKLPSYIKPCHASDPNLSECGLKHAQDALPRIIKGDSKYKIPNLSPLKLPEIKISSGNLNVHLINAVIKGIDNTQVTDMQIDLKKQHISLTVYIDNVNLISRYEISGNLLIFPIQGKGQANLTFTGGTYKYDFDYTLDDRQGDKYLTMKNANLVFKTKRGYFDFENLFGGNAELGEQMNKFLNDNWKDVSQELAPAIGNTISNIISASLNGIFEKVPYKDIILE